VLFAPYDSFDDLRQEVSWIETVTSAKVAFNTSSTQIDDRFSVRYAVYNLLNDDIVVALCRAHTAGVRVQVAIEHRQLLTSYSEWNLMHFRPLLSQIPDSVDASNTTPLTDPDIKNFSNCGMVTVTDGNQTQDHLTEDQKRQYNLIGLDAGGLMHTKMRLFSWLQKQDDTQLVPRTLVLSGSFNPDGDTALNNNETFLTMKNPRLFQRYNDTYTSLLHMCGPTAPPGCVPGPPVVNDAHEDTDGIQFFYSKGSTSNVRSKILELALAENELIFITVYSLRDLTPYIPNPHPWPPTRQAAMSSSTGNIHITTSDDEHLTAPAPNISLVTALCMAAKRGVLVIVITDKDESDGEGGFTAGDPSRTALAIRNCGISVYKAKNYYSGFSAFHHKNGLFGLSSTKVVTDTCNW
jgi:hypothetical protein